MGTRWLLVGLAASVLLRPSVSLAATMEELFEGGQAAIVLAVAAPGRSDLVEFSLLDPGTEISLADGESLQLGYQESCAVEDITGGTVTIGARQSRVVGGTVIRGQVDCNFFRYDHTPPQLRRAAISVFERKARQTAAAADHRHSVAVVIGNKTYTEQVPDVSYAHRDAAAMKGYLTKVLGYRERNIIDLRDATQSQMEAAFGNMRSHEGEIYRMIRPDRSHVTVYYSGHGAPGLDDNKGYLLPVDVAPENVELSGYPIDLLYENLNKLEARSVTVLLDACFSGDSGGGMVIQSASPVFVQTKMPDAADNLTVLTAASDRQVASWDNENQHGLFTYHLLVALRGAADEAPFGDADGSVTVQEAKAYLDEEMTYAAKRGFGRKQDASVRGHGGAVLGHVPDDPAEVLIEPPGQTDVARRTEERAPAALPFGVEIYEVRFETTRIGSSSAICKEESGTFEIQTFNGEIQSSTLKGVSVRGKVTESVIKGTIGSRFQFFEARKQGDVWVGEHYHEKNDVRYQSCRGKLTFARK